MNAADLTLISLARNASPLGRDLRIENRLSLAEVAAAVGVDPAQVSRWEHSKTVPKQEAAIRYGRLIQLWLAGAEAAR